jgi:diguanylate cyclase (GGDEF)-like protein
MAVTLASMLFTLAILSVGILSYEQRENRERAVTDHRIQAAMIARTATAAMEFGDHEAATEILGALDASTAVVRAELRDATGRLLAMRAWAREAPLGGADLFRISEPIEVRGGRIGSVEMEIELGGLRAMIVEYTLAVGLVAAIAALLGYLLLSRLVRRLLAPLDRLSRTTREVKDTGNFGLRAPEDAGDEIGDLARGFNDMLAQIQARDAALETELSQRRETEIRLEHLAHFDPVTQLPNRHYFNERIMRVIDDSKILGARVALLMIDLDDFKLVNDTLGHHVGDRLLELVGRCIKEQVRANDTVARLGGDEFAVILEHVRGTDEPRRVAEKIIAALSESIEVGGRRVHVGVSLGIAIYPTDARSVAGIVRRADTAMYEAKARGKRGYRFFTPEMDGRMQRRVKVEGELHVACGRGELFVVFQPQVNLASGTYAGLEALVRWRHPERGVVGPKDFIEIAEDSGLIVDIGQFVIDEALAHAAVWQAQGIDLGQVAVNVSARQFESDLFVPAVLDALDRHGVGPATLELEITESILMGGSEALGRIQELHRAGVRFAIDDFGTGYSSLSYLKRVPLSTLKIDRHFIRDLPSAGEDRAITQAIIALGQALDLRTVAEGVESGAAMDILRMLGCTFAQGFAISHPLPAEAVPAFVRAWGPRPAAPETGRGQVEPSSFVAH